MHVDKLDTWPDFCQRCPSLLCFFFLLFRNEKGVKSSIHRANLMHLCFMHLWLCWISCFQNTHNTCLHNSKWVLSHKGADLLIPTNSATTALTFKSDKILCQLLYYRYTYTHNLCRSLLQLKYVHHWKWLRLHAGLSAPLRQ